MSDRFSDIDFAITENGDLMLDSDGDLLCVQNMDYVVQTAIDRLKSVASDWFYDKAGADVEASVGQPNTQDTANALIARITDALTKDQFADVNDLLIVGTPLSSSNLMIGVYIKTIFDPTPIGLMVSLNFLTGFDIRRTQ